MQDKISSLYLLGSFFLTACLLFSKPAQAQESISNEYRVILVTTYAFSKDLFLTTYLDYVNNPNSKIISTYIGLPSLQKHHRKIKLWPKINE